MQTITKDILSQVYPPRHPDAKKYDHGLLLVIGGGDFYTGSPALTALAAFRSGCDMVQVLAPQRAANIIAGFSPNLAVYPLTGLWLDQEDLPTLLSLTQSAEAVAPGKTAVVIGGGLGRSEDTQRTVQGYLEKTTNLRAVIDSDGIHAAAKKIEIIRGRNFIFTPHAYEFFILTGQDIKNIEFSEKIKIVQQEAAKLGGIIVLKGRKDIISDGQQVIIDETGSPYMAVGGTGDTLAGIAGSLLAQGAEPFLAAQAASFINGKAGEAAAEKFAAGMMATDLIEEIPNIIKS
jgi:NAD(P)H-hydrate epimerase